MQLASGDLSHFSPVCGLCGSFQSPVTHLYGFLNLMEQSDGPSLLFLTSDVENLGRFDPTPQTEIHFSLPCISMPGGESPVERELTNANSDMIILIGGTTGL